MKIICYNGVEMDVEINDQVQMHWWGDGNIPKSLSYGWATVIRFTSRGNLVVVADSDAYGTRTLIPGRHVLRVKEKI